MTEKRFIADNEYVMQNSQVWVVCGGEHSANVVATALNELIDENEELDTKCSQLEKENEQLKSILQETIGMLEARFKQDEDTFYAVTLVVNLDMFHKMKKIMG